MFFYYWMTINYFKSQKKKSRNKKRKKERKIFLKKGGACVLFISQKIYYYKWLGYYKSLFFYFLFFRVVNKQITVAPNRFLTRAARDCYSWPRTLFSTTVLCGWPIQWPESGHLFHVNQVRNSSTCTHTHAHLIQNQLNSCLFLCCLRHSCPSIMSSMTNPCPISVLHLIKKNECEKKKKKKSLPKKCDFFCW